ncbi:hypothetical protein SDJN02_01861, partial [Cucurbita argyrosperma subsp. argyrosperma]
MLTTMVEQRTEASRSTKEGEEAKQKKAVVWEPIIVSCSIGRLKPGFVVVKATGFRSPGLPATMGRICWLPWMFMGGQLQQIVFCLDLDMDRLRRCSLVRLPGISVDQHIAGKDGIN